jgi:hypothetical protein
MNTCCHTAQLDGPPAQEHAGLVKLASGMLPASSNGPPSPPPEVPELDPEAVPDDDPDAVPELDPAFPELLPPPEL